MRFRVLIGRVKKSNVALAIAHIWTNNFTVKQFQIQSMNITSVETKLMAIQIGLIPTMEYNEIHNIIIITDSITATSKILEF